MNDFKVNIPIENYQIIEFNKEGLPAIAVINSSLVKFEPKEVFSWCCSIILDYENLNDNGMPQNEDLLKSEKFEDFLNDKVKGVNKDKPSTLFLARVTWNKTRQLIWRVNDPEPINTLLNSLIEENDNPFEFDFRIEIDEEWKLTEWYLDNFIMEKKGLKKFIDRKR